MQVSNPALIKSLLPSTLNLEFKVLVIPADQRKRKTFLFVKYVCGLAFDARREQRKTDCQC